MVKKSKLRYKNFNVCQLIDKGKMKLQYLDEFKESKKIHGEINKKVNHEDKRRKLKKEENVNLEHPINTFGYEKILCSFNYIENLKNNINFQFLNNCCKFVEFENKFTKEKKCGILVLDDLVLVLEEMKEKSNLTYENVEETKSYLVDFDMIKESYTLEDIKIILKKYIETKEENKKLVKE